MKHKGVPPPRHKIRAYLEVKQYHDSFLVTTHKFWIASQAYIKLRDSERTSQVDVHTLTFFFLSLFIFYIKQTWPPIFVSCNSFTSTWSLWVFKMHRNASVHYSLTSTLWHLDYATHSNRPNSLVLITSRGVHSIVKLNTTCENYKSTFYIKDHQNRSNIFHFFFTSRYTQDLLHNKKL